MQPDSAIHAVLDRIYAVERGAQAWIEGVVDAARPLLERGHGVHGYLIDASERSRLPTMSNVVANGCTSDWYSRWWLPASRMPIELAHQIHTFGPCGYAGDLKCLDEQEVPALQRRVAEPYRMAFGVNGLDSSRVGCVLVSPRRSPPSSEEAERERSLWSLLGGHLASGARLVRRLSGSPVASAEAVLSPDGRTLHAAGPAREPIARAALREAALRADRLRTSRSRQRQRVALARMPALVDERWSVLDHFDHDGRRYVIAIPNAPLADGDERVASLLTLGHSTKLIAYELGVSISTVSRRVRRLARALGARSRPELIRLLRAQDLQLARVGGPLT